MTLNNHWSGDFKPYVVKSTDLGRTWTNISSDLPARGDVWSLAEDHVDRNLLFVGTEFGLFFTNDGGKKWTQLKGGLPTIQVRDIAIQRRENDLVLATFGRGFYVLDDYSPLRVLNEQTIVQAGGPMPAGGRVGPVDRCDGITARRRRSLPRASRAALRRVESARTSGQVVPGREPLHGEQPAVTARSSRTTSRTRSNHARTSAKKPSRQLAKKNADVFYPPWDSLKAEDRAEDPAVIVTVSDASGQVVRRFTAPASAGINRVAWDLRLQPTDPVNGPPYKPDPDFPFTSPPLAPFVPPGTYQVALLEASRRRVHGARRSAALSSRRRRQRARSRDGDDRGAAEGRGARARRCSGHRRW